MRSTSKRAARRGAALEGAAGTAPRAHPRLAPPPRGLRGISCPQHDRENLDFRDSVVCQSGGGAFFVWELGGPWVSGVSRDFGEVLNV